MRLFFTQKQSSMKRIFQTAALALFIVLVSSWRSDLAAQPYPPDNYNNNNNEYGDEEVSYQKFYDELSPYGQWVQHPSNGYVWVPDADDNFRPYATNGHWVYTDDYEWMWVSDYDWGWAPFHYGRWDQDQYLGWYWVPGYEWSPAWVAWRDGGDYYGWAPLRPGISINISIGAYNPPYDFWSFAPRRYINHNRIYDYYYDRRQNITIINHTTIINNYGYRRNVFCAGPRRADVEIYIGRISPVRFRSSSRPGRSIFRNNEVNFYRPNVRRDNDRQFAPRQFERYDRERAQRGERFERSNGRNGRPEGNRFERNDNQPNRNNGRIERRDENVRQPQQNGNGRFERQRNDNNRQGEVRTPREREPRVNPGNNGGNRNFERRAPERNSQPQVREPRREVRSENRPPQQVERRQSLPQQPQRQFERRNDNNRPQGRTDNGGGNGRGRNRF